MAAKRKATTATKAAEKRAGMGAEVSGVDNVAEPLEGPSEAELC
jgi:hypothetical protein